MRLGLVLCLVATGLSAESDRVSRRAAAAVADEAQITARARAPRIGTDAVITSGSENWMFIGAAGSVQGNFGTFFRSDVMISNQRSIPQNVLVTFLPQGRSGFSTQERTITVPANGVMFFEDIVARTLGESGLGALEFQTRTSTDGFDLDGKIDVYSRIYTNQPGATGTVSQTFIGADLLSTRGSDRAISLGLRHDDTFRTNVGIVNLDFLSTRTWTVQIIGSSGSATFPVTVGAFSMNQVSVPAGNYGNLRVVFTPESAMTSSWNAYASSTDNRTGDGWVSPASQVP